jgi:hypothetical protein
VWLPVTVRVETTRLFLSNRTWTGMASYRAWDRNGPSHGAATPETTPTVAGTVVGDEAVDAQPVASAATGNTAAIDQPIGIRIPSPDLDRSVAMGGARGASGIPLVSVDGTDPLAGTRLDRPGVAGSLL